MQASSRMSERKPWDVFVSHASEDKDAFVRPLAAALQSLGVSIWYDEFSLRVGDSLSRSIDKGIAGSRLGGYGIPDAFEYGGSVKALLIVPPDEQGSAVIEPDLERRLLGGLLRLYGRPGDGADGPDDEGAARGGAHGRA